LLEPDPNSEIYRTFSPEKARLRWGRHGILVGHRHRHCGTGIWPDRDIAAGWRAIDTRGASLPTRSPSQPRTAARKAGVLDPRRQLRERDGLSAGGRRIRTFGPQRRQHFRDRPVRALKARLLGGATRHLFQRAANALFARRQAQAPPMQITANVVGGGSRVSKAARGRKLAERVGLDRHGAKAKRAPRPSDRRSGLKAA